LKVYATHPQLNIETLRQAQGWLWGNRAGGFGYGMEGGEGCWLWFGYGLWALGYEQRRMRGGRRSHPSEQRPLAGEPGSHPSEQRPLAGEPGFHPSEQRPLAGEPGCATDEGAVRRFGREDGFGLRGLGDDGWGRSRSLRYATG
jgi:hypothetical protein